MRALFVILHRCAGLAIAAFLFIAGLTGSIIAWDHELDGWLNPDLLYSSSRGPFFDPFELARHVEASDSRAFVTYLPLHFIAGETVAVLVDARVNPATGELYDLGYNQVFVDPVTGTVSGRREWGALGFDRQHLVPFLYKLHFSLCIPEFWGVEKWGVWLMGGVALLWMADCFFGFALTLPPKSPIGGQSPGARWRERWAKSWRIKWGGSAFRLNFDIHRAAGLWYWALLFIVALTAASLNLYSEVARPAVSLFSTFTPTPYDLRVARPRNDPVMPRVTMREIAARAHVVAALRRWEAPPGVIGYAQQYGVYNVQFFEPGGEYGRAGASPPELFFDGKDGRYIGDRLPWHGTAGDLFLQLQFPLHSGRIAGLAGRIVITLTGLAVAALSVTGVVIWRKKRSARTIRIQRSREIILTKTPAAQYQHKQP